MADASEYKGADDHHGQSRTTVVKTISPGNGAAATLPEGAQTVLVNPDGTNTVDPDNLAVQGAVVTVVHNGGAATPTLAFDDADFVGTGPANITSAGATATLRNTDGTTSGWVVEATGSA